jgi:ParB-like chromosome segregation protein Spo0J
MTVKTYALKDIQSNPFRHMERYPINRTKVEALKESINSTSFWENVVARKTKDGGAELAYGHHRLIALRELYGQKHEIDLIIKPLSDEMMLQIMARENLAEWGSNVAVEHETVRAVVQAYAEGRIELPASDESAKRLRYAPSFVAGLKPDQGRVLKPYTIQTVADFLGWNKGKAASIKVTMAIRALEYIELGILREKDFEGVSPKDARATIEEASKAYDARMTVARDKEAEARDAEKRAKSATSEKQREAAERKAAAARRVAEEKKAEAKPAATRVGRDVAEKIQSGAITYLGAKQHARKVDPDRPQSKPKRQTPLHIDDMAEKVAERIGRYLNEQEDAWVTERLDALVEHRGAVRVSAKTSLVKTLERLASRASSYARKLQDTHAVNGHAQLGGS